MSHRRRWGTKVERLRYCNALRRLTPLNKVSNGFIPSLDSVCMKRNNLSRVIVAAISIRLNRELRVVFPLTVNYKFEFVFSWRQFYNATEFAKYFLLILVQVDVLHAGLVAFVQLMMHLPLIKFTCHIDQFCLKRPFKSWRNGCTRSPNMSPSVAIWTIIFLFYFMFFLLFAWI